MRGLVAAVVAVALGGCTQVYKDSRTGFEVTSNAKVTLGPGFINDTSSAQRGPLHPAVIEYVIGAPEGPIARYYDVMLRLSKPPRVARADMAALEPDARALAAGGRVTGHHYARALGRRLVPHVNRALVAKPNAREISGTAGLRWGVPTDLDRGRVRDEYERIPGFTTMRTTLSRYETVQLVMMSSTGTETLYAWDMSAVPGAFGEDAALDYDTVAATAKALHP